MEGAERPRFGGGRLPDLRLDGPPKKPPPLQKTPFLFFCGRTDTKTSLIIKLEHSESARLSASCLFLGGGPLLPMEGVIDMLSSSGLGGGGPEGLTPGPGGLRPRREEVPNMLLQQVEIKNRVSAGSGDIFILN